MPTSISNAVGTARQFTPQPDGGYVGNYNRVSATQSAVAPVNAQTDLATNMMKLSDALQGYLVSHEKYKNAIGSMKATRFINSQNPEDLARLNVIDAAQVEGYADDTANPYFLAYAEKLKGGFLSEKMKNEYDELYAASPAKTADEEAKRFAEFSKDWKDRHTNSDNVVAFDMGYNENNLVNFNSLITGWTKKKIQESTVVTLAHVQNELSKVLQNSGQLLATNGAFTDAVQTALNPVRLMGLPMAERMKLVQDFLDKAVGDGRIPHTRLKQMMERVTVISHMDGTQEKMSDLFDMHEIGQRALANNIKYASTQKEAWLKKYGDGKKYDEFLKETEEMRWTNPDEFALRQSIMGQVYAREKQKKAEEAQARREQARLAAIKAAKAKGKVSDPDDLNDLISIGLQRGNMWRGKPLSSVQVDEEAFYPVLLAKTQELIANDDAQGLSLLMSLPQAKNLRKSIGDAYANTLDSLTIGDDGFVHLDDPANANVANMLNMMQSNSAVFESCFGSQLANRVQTIKTLQEVFGDPNSGSLVQGLTYYATFSRLPQADQQEYKSQARSYIENDVVVYTSEGAQNLNPNQGGSETINLTNDADSKNLLVNTTAVLMSRGYGVDDALNRVGDSVRNNFYAYRGATIPKSVVLNLGMGSGADRKYFQTALDNETDNDYDVQITYDRSNQLFYFSDPYKTHTVGGSEVYSWSKPLSYIRLAAVEAGARDGEEEMQRQNDMEDVPASEETPEDYNGARAAAEMAGATPDPVEYGWTP